MFSVCFILMKLESGLFDLYLSSVRSIHTIQSDGKYPALSSIIKPRPTAQVRTRGADQGQQSEYQLWGRAPEPRNVLLLPIHPPPYQTQ